MVVQILPGKGLQVSHHCMQSLVSIHFLLSPRLLLQYINDVFAVHAAQHREKQQSIFTRTTKTDMERSARGRCRLFLEVSPECVEGVTCASRRY